MRLRIPVCSACGLLAPCGKCAINGFDTTLVDLDVEVIDEPAAEDADGGQDG